MTFLGRLRSQVELRLPPFTGRRAVERRFERLERALALSPQRPDLLREYGVILFRRRRFASAAKQFTLWARAAPTDADSLVFLARALIRLKEREHAKTALWLALNRDPRHPRGLRLLAALSPEDAARAKVVDPDLVDQGATVAQAADPRRDNIAEDGEAAPTSLAAAAWKGLIEKVDDVIAFLAFEKGLVLRQIAIQSKKNAVQPFRQPFILIVFIFVHMFLFYFLGRPFAGGISYFNAVLGAFLPWVSLKAAFYSVTRSNFHLGFNKSSNIKWIHIFLADLTWDCILLLLAAVFALELTHLILPPIFLGTILFPNLLMVFFTFALAILLGVGLGLVLHVLGLQVPVIAAIDHTLLWIFYVTSGVYTSYVTTPWFIAQVFQYNPLLTIVEYTRFGLDSSYPVGNLTLPYPIWCVTAMITFGLILQNWERRMATQ